LDPVASDPAQPEPAKSLGPQYELDTVNRV
jgi:hypothetical protein